MTGVIIRYASSVIENKFLQLIVIFKNKIIINNIQILKKNLKIKLQWKVVLETDFNYINWKVHTYKLIYL